MEGVELGVDGFVVFGVEDPFKRGRVRFADGFAVPACAFGVKFVEHVLVRFARPFERCGEFCRFDLVVVVDECFGLEDGVGVVGWWGELVGVPG